MEQTKAIIADDEDQLRRYLRAQLAEVWPDLIISGEARNGQEALELIERYQPEIAFLDIRMPGLSLSPPMTSMQWRPSSMRPLTIS
jgi:YesN/AraC family two-component response regulator